MTASTFCVQAFALGALAVVGIIFLLAVINAALSRDLERSYNHRDELPRSILRARVEDLKRSCKRQCQKLIDETNDVADAVLQLARGTRRSKSREISAQEDYGQSG
ncbi:MAG: hypothetical protein KDD66_04330 [Bdellovibrionales bacterium]|nr:hypothetical protein [Bdellovibrionales bacterium]